MAIRACVVVMLLGLLGRSFACEDVTVVYRDGRYLVLEINTLEVVDVGNLWWLGISSIPVLYPGSSSARFAFSTNRLGRVLGEPDVGSLPQEALVVLENLAERTSTFDYEIYRSRHARWVAGTDRLAVWQQKRSKFSILDAGLGKLDSWTLPEHDVGELFACPTEGGLVVAGYRQRTVYKGPDVIVDTLAFPEGTKDCALSGPFLDCMGASSVDGTAVSSAAYCMSRKTRWRSRSNTRGGSRSPKIRNIAAPFYGSKTACSLRTVGVYFSRRNWGHRTHRGGIPTGSSRRTAFVSSTPRAAAL